MLRAQVMQLGNQVHLERTADTAVLQRHKRVIVLGYHPALLDKRGIDIHFTDIIDDNGKANTFFVGKNAVQQSGLTAS